MSNTENNMLFAILNNYTGDYLASGKDMVTMDNMVTYDNLDDAEFCILTMTLRFPNCSWKVVRLR